MPSLLTVLLVLSSILPLPIWFLLILMPRSNYTRRVADSYLIFIVLGAFFIFMLVGTTVSGIGVLTQGGVIVTPAATAGPTNAPTPTATSTVAQSVATSAATQAATAAATAAANAPVINAASGPIPIPLGDLLANSFVSALALMTWIGLLAMDLLVGHWIYHEAIRQEAPVIVSSFCIFLAFLFGPLGLFVFVIWRALTQARRAALAKAGITDHVAGA